MAVIKIDKITRSKRRTIGLYITSDACLIVRAPKSASLKTIQDVVAKHENWIRKKQEDVRLHPRQSRPKEFIEGEEFLFLGQPYRLNIHEDNSTPLKYDNGFYLSREYLPKARQLFVNWYTSRATEIISERVRLFAQKNSLTFSRLRISNAKCRWGSCSSKGNLNFSWRLIMAPIESIDYVVVHELAHLKHRNHSRKFWDEVERMMPGYKKQKLWLKENESQMIL